MNHPASRPLVYAHRGARADEPENTLRAYRRALAEGADGIELDIHLTADGHLVVIHDRTVDRTTDGTGAVAEFTLAGLKELDAGEGERIPTFEEAMEVCGDVVQIELKALEAVAALAERDRRTPLPEPVMLTSFNPAAIEEAARLLPHIPRGLIGHHPGDQLVQDALELKAAWVCPEFRPDFTPDFVARCHAAGLRIDAWPTKERDHARRWVEYGVDAMTTDYPARIAQWLEPEVPGGPDDGAGPAGAEDPQAPASPAEPPGAGAGAPSGAASGAASGATD